MSEPLTAFSFSVFLQRAPTASAPDLASPLGSLGMLSSTRMGFAEISGLNAELDVETYREGGNNANPLRFPTWGNFTNLVMRRGVSDTTDLWDWHARVTYEPLLATERRNALVLLHDRVSASPAGASGAPQAIAMWFVQNALPARLLGPSLNARANELAIETLELAHEGVVRISAANVPGLSSFLSSRGSMA
jgi:phage tail-like protein